MYGRDYVHAKATQSNDQDHGKITVIYGIK